MPYRSILAVVVLGSCLSCGSSSGSEEPGTPGGAGASSGGGAGAGGGNGAGAGGATGGTGTGGASGGTSSAGASGGSSPPSIGACPVFPSGDAWNTDVSDEPTDADWTARLHAMVGDIQLHPDYGRDGDELYGIPINVVPEDQPLVEVTFDWWAEESDPGPYPFPGPDMVEIEGNDPASMDGDRHLLVVQEGTCRLYEGYACYHDGEWHCGNGATWDLDEVSYGQRPEGWTSADAAGLAVTPGILRYDEVVARDVRHALRFTTACTRPNYVAPATHYAVPGGCDEDDPNSPPMGLRVRLRADFDTSSFSEGARAVLTAMQTYGMILADNGSNFYFQGEAHPDWNLDEIEELKTVPVSEFEVLQPGPLEP